MPAQAETWVKWFNKRSDYKGVPRCCQVEGRGRRGQLRTGRLKLVLDSYAPTVPGFFVYFPSRAQRSAPLRLFIDAAKELAVRKVK